jgi:DNA-directed RNA polymerase sigma subunit (sigma70/sigma32)
MKGTKEHAAKKGSCMTQADIAKVFGISKGRVQQIEARALAKLRRSPILKAALVELGIRMPSSS